MRELLVRFILLNHLVEVKMYKIEKIRREEVIMKNEIPEKEVLEKLMLELGSMGKVAVQLNRPYGTIRAWFNKYKLDRPKSNRTIFHEIRDIDFSNIQKSVVLGSILGDGGLVIPKHGKNAKLSIKHCSKQKPYLVWKKEILNPFSRPIYQTSEEGEVNICGIPSYDTGSFVAYTVSHPTLTEFYNKYYIKGKKKVDKSIIKDLDLLALAILLADDGSFYTHYKFKGVCNGKICTNSFSYEDQLLLIEAIKKFYGDKGINLIPYGVDKSQFVIKLTNSKATSDLLSKVREILPECIHYKLDPQRLHAEPHFVGDDIV